jgi:hypothetical protein
VQQTTPKPKPVQHAHLTEQQRQLLQKEIQILEMLKVSNFAFFKKKL